MKKGVQKGIKIVLLIDLPPSVPLGQNMPDCFVIYVMGSAKYLLGSHDS
jgi:hypothetical protein